MSLFKWISLMLLKCFGGICKAACHMPVRSLQYCKQPVVWGKVMSRLQWATANRTVTMQVHNVPLLHKAYWYLYGDTCIYIRLFMTSFTIFWEAYYYCNVCWHYYYCSHKKHNFQFLCLGLDWTMSTGVVHGHSCIVAYMADPAWTLLVRAIHQFTNVII